MNLTGLETAALRDSSPPALTLLLQVLELSALVDGFNASYMLPRPTVVDHVSYAIFPGDPSSERTSPTRGPDSKVTRLDFSCAAYCICSTGQCRDGTGTKRTHKSAEMSEPAPSLPIFPLLTDPASSGIPAFDTEHTPPLRRSLVNKG